MVKYEVGDWVTLKGIVEEHRFIITEVIQQTCTAGTQIAYSGRLYHKMHYPHNGNHTSFTIPAVKMTEMEIKEKAEMI